MKMNVRKTKSAVISNRGEPTPIKIEVDGAEIEQVQNFLYLGHKITGGGRIEEEIKRRIGIVRTAFSKMHRILTSPQTSLETRLAILQCYIWLILMFVAETLTKSKTLKERLYTFEMCCLPENAQE